MRGQPDCDRRLDKQQVQDKDDRQSACKSRTAAYRLLSQRFNALSKTPAWISHYGLPRPPRQVLGADRYPVMARLLLVGAIDRLLDCADVLSHRALTLPHGSLLIRRRGRRESEGVDEERRQLRGTNAHARACMSAGWLGLLSGHQWVTRTA